MKRKQICQGVRESVLELQSWGSVGLHTHFLSPPIEALLFFVKETDTPSKLIRTPVSHTTLTIVRSIPLLCCCDIHVVREVGRMVLNRNPTNYFAEVLCPRVFCVWRSSRRWFECPDRFDLVSWLVLFTGK